MRKKTRKNIHFSINQRSFHFNDYLETNQKLKNKNHKLISDDRIYILFFSFVSLILVFSLKITLISIQKTDFSKTKNSSTHFVSARRDIVDRNGELLARNIQTYHAGIRSNLVKDKKKFLVKVKLAFPELNNKVLISNLNKKKYFYLKKRLTDLQREKLWKLGEKGIIFEPFQTRVYPHAGLYSHIIGQTDYDNYGISGVENYFDNFLRNRKNISIPLKLSLDTNIQFLIKSELEKALDIFQAKGAASILMDSDNGEVLSLVSLPDFDPNKRENIKDKNYINKITKGVYELGSVFKTFTLAAALDENLIEVDTKFIDLEKSIDCGKNTIREYDKKIPKDLTAEEILIRSGNIGSVRIGQKIGVEKFKQFLTKINLINKIEFDIDEIGIPIPFKWGKCKLATTSFGHGITTTPLQLAKGYAIVTNGGFDVNPTIIKKKSKKLIKYKKRVLKENVSKKINPILRKIVTSKEGTANLADVKGYEIGGKTGTAEKIVSGTYSNQKKINTFASVFPISNPEFVLVVILDEPKINSEYIYNYRDGSNFKLKGSPRNTSGWTSVEATGHIIEKIGPILATKYIEIN